MSGNSKTFDPFAPRDLLYQRPTTAAVLKETIHEECHQITNHLAIIIGEASLNEPDIAAIQERGSQAAAAVRRLVEATTLLC